MANLPTMRIGNLETKCIIQGGMGVCISGANLASAVANEDCIGIIASVGLGLLKNYPGDYAQANQDAFRDEIRTARKKSNGVIGVNIMHALTDYESLVEAAVQENVDLIISGAGIPRNLPKLVGDKPIKLIPIVSSLRFAKLITNGWNRHGKRPDAFIVEGPEAGGHLGFEYKNLVNHSTPKLEEIAREVIDFAKNSFNESIPVIVAGGIYTGQDIRKYIKLGAAGVQMATRFVTTYECDAEIEFKRTYLNAKKEDIEIIDSPVGLPGRAIKNPFLEKGEKKFQCRYQCLKTCSPNKSPYCIAKALVAAQKGDMDNGFAFAGSNAWRATPESCQDNKGRYIPAKTLVKTITHEYNAPSK